MAGLVASAIGIVLDHDHGQDVLPSRDPAAGSFCEHQLDGRVCAEFHSPCPAFSDRPTPCSGGHVRSPRQRRCGGRHQRPAGRGVPCRRSGLSVFAAFPTWYMFRSRLRHRFTPVPVTVCTAAVLTTVVGTNRLVYDVGQRRSPAVRRETGGRDRGTCLAIGWGAVTPPCFLGDLVVGFRKPSPVGTMGV